MRGARRGQWPRGQGGGVHSIIVGVNLSRKAVKGGQGIVSSGDDRSCNDFNGKAGRTIRGFGGDW